MKKNKKPAPVGVSKIKSQGIKTRDVRNMNQSNLAMAVEEGNSNFFKKEADIARAANKKSPVRKSMLSPVKTVKLAVDKARVKNAESRVAKSKARVVKAESRLSKIKKK